MPQFDGIPIWEVDLSVLGPITVSEIISFRARKELQHPDPFYSKITVKQASNGIKVTLTAFAPNSNLAQKAGLLFLGRALDVLSLMINLPLQLDFSNNTIIPKNPERIRQIVDRDLLSKAFDEARLLNLTETTFLRALGWFRKGKYTQDSLDRFLAFWNSIETVANKYNPNKETCKDKGSICKIWECFKSVWGEVSSWEFIPNNTDWIDNCTKIRNNIAHGSVSVDIEFIDSVLSHLPNLEKVSHKFLVDWRDKQLNPTITDEIRQRLY